VAETYYDARVVSHFAPISAHDRQVSNKLHTFSTLMHGRQKLPPHLIDIRPYGMAHDRLGDPREDENGDLSSWERRWLMWCVVALDMEKGGLLVAIVIKSCETPLKGPKLGHLEIQHPRGHSSCCYDTATTLRRKAPVKGSLENDWKRN
jgi:hypothetical protein